MKKRTETTNTKMKPIQSRKQAHEAIENALTVCSNQVHDDTLGVTLSAYAVFVCLCINFLRV